MQSFKALKAKSVEEVYPEIIERITEGETTYYVGVKNTHVIPNNYLQDLERKNFLIHTKDVMANNGRAIDLERINPITGRYMTGSSSGTAINVFLGINDIGIGTDGGGSVLAPACALNLYGFISPLICHNELRKYQKTSTDGIVFSPSIGFITKDLKSLTDIVKASINLEASSQYELLIAKPKQLNQLKIFETLLLNAQSYDLNYDSLTREKMIQELQKIDFKRHVLVTFEGPVDLLSYGDSIMGHYSTTTQEQQNLSHKYYLKVVNMLGLSALVVPTFDLSVGILLISDSSKEGIKNLLEVAQQIPFNRSSLETKYFEGGLL